MDTTPPFQLKNIYTPAFLKNYATLVQQVWSPFPADVFLKKVFDDTWEDLALKERMRHISVCLRATLPGEFRDAAGVLVGTAAQLIAENGEKMVFEYMFLPDFIEQYGVDDPEFSISALETITRCTSAEFGVRPFLLKYPDLMYPQMMQWASHPSFCVRRLASEGFRPRLPWGMGIPVLKKDPSPILPVLHLLKNDPTETVRRSVANNLNDISKDHPDVVLNIAGEWKGTHPDTDWIVRHACRGLLKNGHPVALSLFGFEPTLSTVSVTHLQCSPEVNIGGRLDFSFTLTNEAAADTKVRLEYIIDYITSTGKNSRKIFKIKELFMLPLQSEQISKYQRFQDFTTRKHFAGQHRIGIAVNGQVLQEAFFQVVS